MIGRNFLSYEKECALAHSRAEARLLRQPSTFAPSAHPRGAFLYDRTQFPIIQKSPFTPMRKGTIIYRGTTQLPANKTFTDTFRYVTYTRRQCLLWLKCLRVFASCAPASGFQQCSSRGKFGYLSERKEAHSRRPLLSDRKQYLKTRSQLLLL